MVKHNGPLQIRLTEPVIFLKGPSVGEDLRGRPQAVNDSAQPAMLRGLLTLRLSKPTRIRSIGITLEGKSRTEWPEGIGPKRTETHEEHAIISAHTTYFDATSHRPSSRSQSRADPRDAVRRVQSVGPGAQAQWDLDDDEWERRLGISGDDADASDVEEPSRRGRAPARSASVMPHNIEEGASHSWAASAPASRRSSFNRGQIQSSQSRGRASQLAHDPTTERGPSPAYTPVASPQMLPSRLRDVDVPPLPSDSPASHSRQGSASDLPSLAQQLHLGLSNVNTRPSSRSQSALSPIASATHSSSTSDRTDSTSRERVLGVKHTHSHGPTPHHHHSDLVDLAEDATLEPESSILRQGQNTDGTSTPGVRFDETPPVDMEGRGSHLTVADDSHMPETFSPSASTTSLNSIQPARRAASNPALTECARIQDQSIAPSTATSAATSISSRRSSLLRETSRLGGSNTPASASTSASPHSSPHSDLPDVAPRQNQTRSGRVGSTSTLTENRRVASTSTLETTAADSRGRKASRSRFNLAAAIRGLSQDVKDRVTHHGSHQHSSSSSVNSRSASRLGSHSRSRTPVPAFGDFAAMAASTQRPGQGSQVVHHDSSSSLHNDQRTRPSSVRRTSDDAGAVVFATSKSRSREKRRPSPTRGDSGRSESRGRGRNMGMKALTGALGLNAGHDGEDSGEELHNWKEFRKGVYNYPISFPIPASAPPTIHTEFGSVVYRLKATVVKVGALTPNLIEDIEVTMVASPQEDDTEETENVIVERQWEEQMRYQISLSGKAFPIGGTIPMSIRLMPLLKCKLYRLTVSIEEKTDYFAGDKKVVRHEQPKRFPLLAIKHVGVGPAVEPILPIISDSPTALADSPLAGLAHQPTPDEETLLVDEDDAAATLLNPMGPWLLEKDLHVPDCVSKIKFSTKHQQTNISVGHWLKVVLRVERGDDVAVDAKGRRKQFDIIIETPLKILDCRVNTQWNSLPTYAATTPAGNGSVPGICSVHGKVNAVGPTTTPGSTHASISGNNGPSAAPPMFGGWASTQPVHHSPLAGLIENRPVDQAPSHREGEDTLLERNIVFDRLVSGQVSEMGEAPPTYGEALNSAARSASRPGSRSQSRVRQPFVEAPSR